MKTKIIFITALVIVFSFSSFSQDFSIEKEVYASLNRGKENMTKNSEFPSIDLSDSQANYESFNTRGFIGEDEDYKETPSITIGSPIGVPLIIMISMYFIILIYKRRKEKE